MILSVLYGWRLDSDIELPQPRRRRKKLAPRSRLLLSLPPRSVSTSVPKTSSIGLAIFPYTWALLCRICPLLNPFIESSALQRAFIPQNRVPPAHASCLGVRNASYHLPLDHWVRCSSYRNAASLAEHGLICSIKLELLSLRCPQALQRSCICDWLWGRWQVSRG